MDRAFVSETVARSDAGAEPTGVRPMKEKCQWHFSRPHGLAMGKPEICQGSGG